MRSTIAAVPVAALFLAGGTASASPHTTADPNAGAANLGSISGVFGGQDFESGRLGRCTVAGTQHARMEAVRFGYEVTYGGGDTSCTRFGYTLVTRAAGDWVGLDALGGSRYATLLSNYAAFCTSTRQSATAKIAIDRADLSDTVVLPKQAKKLPDPIPKNYTATVRTSAAGPGGTLVFNEQVPNGRGGTTVSVAHFKQRGGGDIYVARADCAPLY